MRMIFTNIHYFRDFDTSQILTRAREGLTTFQNSSCPIDKRKRNQSKKFKGHYNSILLIDLISYTKEDYKGRNNKKASRQESAPKSSSPWQAYRAALPQSKTPKSNHHKNELL